MYYIIYPPKVDHPLGGPLGMGSQFDLFLSYIFPR